MLIKVSLSVNIFEPLTYRFSGTAERVPVGTRVLVPLGRRLSGGWVVGADSAYRGSAKPVIGTMGSGFFPDARLLEFSRQVAETYFVSQGSILDHALPPRSKPLASLRFRDGGQCAS